MGLFGQLSPDTQQMLGGGMFQNAPQSIAPQMQIPQGMFGSAPNVAAPKPGFNEPGGWGEKLGRIGAILMASAGDDAGSRILAGQDDTRLQNLRHQQALDDYQGQSQAALQRERAMYDYKQAHPESPAPTELEREYNWLKGQGRTTEAESLLKSKTTAPPLVQHNGDGTMTVYPAGAIPQGGGLPAAAPKPGTIEGGFRFRGGNPADQNNWEPAGGASAGPARTFP